MDNELAAKIFAKGEVVEENLIGNRIWPQTIGGRWLQRGEKVIKYGHKLYVVRMPELAERK